MISNSVVQLFGHLGIDQESTASHHYFSQSLLTHITNGVIGIDLNYRLIFWNQVMEQIIGYSEKEVIGCFLFELFPFFASSGNVSRFSQALKGASSRMEELPFFIPEKNKSGLLSANIFPVNDAVGYPVGALCLFEDITSAKENQKQLMAERQFNDKLVNTLPHYIVISDLFTEQLLYTNKNLEKLLGFSLSEESKTVSQLINEFIHPEDAEKIVSHKQQWANIRDDQVLEIEFRVFNGQQQWIWLQTSSSVFQRNQQGEPSQIITSIADITDKKKAQLLATEIVQDLPLAISMYQPVRNGANEITDFTLVLANTQSAKEYGYTREQLLGKSILSELPQNWPGIFPLWQHTIQTGEPFDQEYSYQQQDGSPTWLRLRGVKLDDKLLVIGENITQLQQHKAALRRQESLMNETEQMAHMGSWERNLQTEEILWSDQLYTLFGLEKDDPLRLEKLNEQILPEDRPAIFDLYKQLSDNPGQHFYHQYRIKLPNGSIRHLAGYVRSEKNRSGEVGTFKGYVQDITQVKELEHLMGQIVASSLDGVVAAKVIRDEQGQIIDFEYLLINGRGGQILSITEQEVIGKRMLSLYPHLKPQGIFEQYVKVVETKVPMDIEVYYPYDKLKHWFRIVAVSIEEGIVITFSDITRQQEQYFSLKKLHSQLDLILSNIEEGVVELDKKGAITFINMRVVQLTGFSSDELLGLPYDRLIYGNQTSITSLQPAAVLINKALQTGTTQWGSEETFYRKDGTSFTAEYTISPVFEKEHSSGVVLTFRDISEKKQFQSRLQLAYRELMMAKEKLEAVNEHLEKKVQERTLELQAKNEQLTQINLDLDTFVYAASHDLKAPITNIEGLVKLLNRQLGTDNRFHTPMQMIFESIQRFKSILRDLSEVVKVQDSSNQLVESVNLPALLTDLKEDLTQLISSSDAVIQEEWQVENLHFSRKNIRSLLFNLLSNAIKYRSPDRAPLVKVSSQPTDTVFVLITIKDNGIGISNQDQPKVFGMLQRIHTHVEGTGIGLYLVKRIVEQTGGRIELESQEGEGSTFKIYLKQ